MSQTITLDRPAHAMGRLYEQLRWGESARHPGLADTLDAVNDRMGGMLEALRSLNETCVAALRDDNLLSAEADATETPERPVGGEETTT